MVSMEQQKLDLQKERLSLNIDVQRKERKYRQNERLYKEKLIAREDYLQAKEDYELALETRHVVQERQKQDSIYRTTQIESLEENLQSMRQNMMLIRQRMDNLNVKSPIDGQLGTLDAELGQSVSNTVKIGQINDLSDYKIEALIDEHYIDRVRSGLPASFERQDARYDLVVSKVYPDVKEGQFKTDFTFTSKRPDNIRTGQTYYINLELGQPSDAILIPARRVLSEDGRQLDLCGNRRRQPGIPPHDPYRASKSAILRSGRRTSGWRESDRIGLRHFRRQRNAGAEIAHREALVAGAADRLRQREYIFGAQDKTHPTRIKHDTTTTTATKHYYSPYI